MLMLTVLGINIRFVQDTSDHNESESLAVDVDFSGINHRLRSRHNLTTMKVNLWLLMLTVSGIKIGFVVCFGIKDRLRSRHI